MDLKMLEIKTSMIKTQRRTLKKKKVDLDIDLGLSVGRATIAPRKRAPMDFDHK
jgi:hypothetical protein